MTIAPTHPATKKPGLVEIYDRDAGTVLGFPSYDALDLYRLTGQTTWTSVRPARKQDQSLPTAVGW